VAQAAALAAQQKGKDLDAEMKQKASAATTAALVAEAATRAENEAHAAQVRNWSGFVRVLFFRGWSLRVTFFRVPVFRVSCFQGLLW
jgi:hypothetical protein